MDTSTLFWVFLVEQRPEKASSYNHTAKQKGWRHYRGQADYFAIYIEQLGKVYLVPVDAVGTTQAMLRLAPTKNRQEKSVRWAHDYEL